MFCKYCGKNIHDLASVCPHCKQKTVRGEQRPAPVATPKPAKKRRDDVLTCLAYGALALYLLVMVILMATARMHYDTRAIYPDFAKFLALGTAGLALAASVVKLCFIRKPSADALLFGTLLPLALSLLAVVTSFVFL